MKNVFGSGESKLRLQLSMDKAQHQANEEGNAVSLSALYMPSDDVLVAGRTPLRPCVRDRGGHWIQRLEYYVADLRDLSARLREVDS